MLKRARCRSEKGNILFLILLAVILFAALSYAVTQSLRGGGTSASSERNLVKSSVITSYPTGVRAAILRMTIGGTDPGNLYFDPPSVFGSASFTATEQALAVFHPNGGGSVYSTIPTDALVTNATPGTTDKWVFNGFNEVKGIGTSTATHTGCAHPTACPGNDVVAFANNIVLELCNKINSELMGTSYSGTPPVIATALTTITNSVANQQTYLTDAAGTTASTHTTEATTTPTSDNITAAGTIDTRPFFCFQNGTSGEYVYYHVLVER